MNRFRRRVISAMFVVLGGSPAAAADGWAARITTDPMTDERTAFARSAFTSPVTPMRAPYADIWGVVVLTCSIEGLSLNFKYKPLLRGGQRQAGGKVFTLPVRFGDAPPFDVDFWQPAGRDLLYVPPSESKALRLVALVLQESEMLIGLPWYNRGTVYFRFDLRGSREAFREACGR